MDHSSLPLLEATRCISAPCRLNSSSLQVQILSFSNSVETRMETEERHCESQVSRARAWARTLIPARTRFKISRSRLHQVDYAYLISSELDGNCQKGIMDVNILSKKANTLNVAKNFV